MSTASYQNVRYEALIRTVKQLRDPDPNPWEVPWLVWAYTDPEHFYYITLKPNGWELGKRDPAYPGGQRFLATGKTRYPVGDWYDVQVEQRDALLSVSVGGKPLVTFTDVERPYNQGRVGAYTEDATVKFQGLKATSVDDMRRRLPIVRSGTRQAPRLGGLGGAPPDNPPVRLCTGRI